MADLQILLTAQLQVPGDLTFQPQPGKQAKAVVSYRFDQFSGFSGKKGSAAERPGAAQLLQPPNDKRELKAI